MTPMAKCSLSRTTMVALLTSMRSQLVRQSPTVGPVDHLAV